MDDVFKVRKSTICDGDGGELIVSFQLTPAFIFSMYLFFFFCAQEVILGIKKNCYKVMGRLIFSKQKHVSNV